MSEPATDPSNAAPAQPALVRHILPVLAGAMVAYALSVVTDNWLAAHGWLQSASTTPSTAGLLAILGYRGLFAILGCHMAARLAPAGQPRIRYALALGALLLALSVIGAVSDRGRLPAWYSLASIALQGPWAIIGGGTATRVMNRAR